MLALPCSLPRLVVLATLMTACGSSDPPPAVSHQPITLDDAQRTTLERFVGAWTHTGGKAEQETAWQAVETVTEPMNALIRGVARSRLRETVKIDATMSFALSEGIVTITRSDRPQPFAAPANGETFAMTTADGDDAKGSLRIDGDAIVTRVETDQGGGERTYRVDADGGLEISARTFSPRLPDDVVHTMHYGRP